MSKPGLLRHFAAIVYDLLLLTALLFLSTALLLPINGGEAFTAGQFYYPVYLLCVSFLFYGWFWTHGGQTLGLKAWKIRVVANDGKAITWRIAMIRFVAAIFSWGCFGLGFIWRFFNQHRLTWHDIASKTTLRLE